MNTAPKSARRPTAWSAIAFAALVTGCAGPPSRPTSTGQHGPPLELLEAGPLVLPADCEPQPGLVYRTRFTVQTDGRVSAAAPDAGAGCVQSALVRWVDSFRYRPPRTVTTATIDWMSVTARRGS